MGVFRKSKLYKDLKHETDPRVIKARRIRKGITPMKNKDGSVSTHRMSTTEAGGKYYAHPTIFPDKKGGWREADKNNKWDSFDESIRRRELFEFKDAKESEAFAKGSWKKKKPSKIGVKLKLKKYGA